MFYIINSNSTLEEFIYAEEIFDFTQNKVHPLFAHMQRELDNDVKQMISQIKNEDSLVKIPKKFYQKMANLTTYEWFEDHNFGITREKVLSSFIPGALQEYDVTNITQKAMYLNHISLNKPAKILNGAKDWAAMKKWDNQTYMLEEMKMT